MGAQFWKPLTLWLLAGIATANAGGDMPAAEAALREALFTRTAADGQQFGPAELDILFYGTTRYLLDEPSHSAGLSALGEFLEGHGEQQLRDPLRRALLQRDLWQLYDWARGEWNDTTHDADRRLALRTRIAAVLQRLQLSDAEIAKLPDNFDALQASADLAGIAPSLRSAKSGWIMVGTSGAEPAALMHTREQEGRSEFLVLVRVPGGRKATLDWLATLQFKKPGTAVPGFNYAASDFPSGTTWALVRVMNVIDASGRLRPTHLVESAQFRTYLDEAPAEGVSFGAGGGYQRIGELRMNRLDPPRLRAMEEWDRQFSHGVQIDWIEDADHHGSAIAGREPPLANCRACHTPWGNRTIRSLVGFQGRETPAFLPTNLEREAAKVIQYKESRPDWQELSRLWTEAR